MDTKTCTVCQEKQAKHRYIKFRGLPSYGTVIHGITSYVEIGVSHFLKVKSILLNDY